MWEDWIFIFFYFFLDNRLIIFSIFYSELVLVLYMQRYGWQTRQSRVNQSLNEPLPTQSNPSTAPEANIKGNDKISSTVVQSKNSSLSSAPGIKQARVSRISSIDSNPLFQGMDTVPVRRRQTLQTQGKQMENPVAIKNEASYQTNIDETKNQQNSKIKRTRTQLTRNQVKLVVETSVETTRQQIPSLRFQKVNKPIQSTLPQKQYLTERPKHDYPIQKLNLQKSEQKQKDKNECKDEDNNKIQEIRITNKAIIPRQQATERKKYDLLDDILFPNKRNARKAQTKTITNTQSLTDNQQSNPKPEKQNQQLGKHFSSNLNQHTKVSQHQQKQLTSTKDKKQMPNKSNGNEKQEEKVIQTNQNVKRNVNDKNKSKILIFCINKLERKNRGQCIGWCIDKLKETKLWKEQVRVGARILSRISLQKMQQFKVYSMVKLVSINNSQKPRFKWPVSSTNATNFSTYRQFLTISVNSIFRDKTKQAFNRIKSSRQLISNNIPILMKLLTNYQVQIQKQVYRRTYDFSVSRRQCKQRGIKRLVCKLSILVNCSLISPFYFLCWASFRPKYEDDNLEDETSIDNHQETTFQSPIVTKNEAISAPNIALSDPSKKRKEQQTLAIRNTAKASNLAGLRLQKQLQSTQKMFQQQKQNNQLRIEQLRQIISEYNFQISSKKQRYKESQLILKQNSIQGEQENQNIKEQRSQKLQHLTSIYFTVLHHKQTTTESQNSGYLNCNQLLRLVQPCQELENREVSQWGILFQNIKLKLQVEALQSSMEGKDGNVGGAMKKRSSWEYANREYQYLVGMVRNYIKQQYYWTKLGKDLQVNPGR